MFTSDGITHTSLLCRHVYIRWYHTHILSLSTCLHQMVSHTHSFFVDMFTSDGITHTSLLCRHVYIRWYHTHIPSLSTCLHQMVSHTHSFFVYMFTSDGITHTSLLCLHVYIRWYHTHIPSLSTCLYHTVSHTHSFFVDMFTSDGITHTFLLCRHVYMTQYHTHIPSLSTCLHQMVSHTHPFFVDMFTSDGITHTFLFVYMFTSHGITHTFLLCRHVYITQYHTHIPSLSTCLHQMASHTHPFFVDMFTSDGITHTFLLCLHVYIRWYHTHIPSLSTCYMLHYCWTSTKWIWCEVIPTSIAISWRWNCYSILIYSRLLHHIQNMLWFYSHIVRSSAGINYFTAQHTTFFLSVPTSTKPMKQPYWLYVYWTAAKPSRLRKQPPRTCLSWWWYEYPLWQSITITNQTDFEYS